MEPNLQTPYRARHSTRGEGAVTRTESGGVGAYRRPIFAPDDGTLAGRVAWSDLEPLASTLGSFRLDENTVYIEGPPSREPQLGEIGDLMREYGLDPDDWVIVSVTINKWEGMTAPQWDEVAKEKINKKMPLRQWKATLRLKPHILLATPATHVPPVKRGPGPAQSERPVTIVVEGDHQIPYHDPKLHEASLYMLEALAKHHRLDEHVLLGDSLDFPTPGKYKPHPAAMAEVNECIQVGYNVFRAKCEAAPNVRRRKLKGNHDWRIESFLLEHASALYNIKPADTPEGGPELPALSLRRLLHLDALGVELVEDVRGWEHAEVELVGGYKGLVVRHGWLVGENTARKSLKKRGRSLIVGHKHERDHVFEWDASAQVERQAVVNGVMCRRDGRFPHFAVCDGWSQGCVVVTRWPTGDFQIEHVRYDGEHLTWRDYRW